MKIGILVGSLRKESLSRKVANELSGLFPVGVDCEYIDMDFPIYNRDLDEPGKEPSGWVEFRNKIEKMDAFLFVTPEYNRSLPALTKNAIDVGSIPKNLWQGKRGAVVSISPGSIGGFGANHVLRQSVVYLDLLLMQQPEMYIGGVSRLFDGGGKPDADTLEFFKNFVAKFIEFVA